MLDLNRGIGQGTKVRITVTEPWEVVSDLPSPTVNGQVLRTDLAAVLVRLDEPISYSGEAYRHFLAHPRLTQDDFTLRSGSVFCAIVSVNDTEAEQVSLTTPGEFTRRLKLMGDVTW